MSISLGRWQWVDSTVCLRCKLIRNWNKPVNLFMFVLCILLFFFLFGVAFSPSFCVFVVLFALIHHHCVGCSFSHFVSHFIYSICLLSPTTYTHTHTFLTFFLWLCLCENSPFAHFINIILLAFSRFHAILLQYSTIQHVHAEQYTTGFHLVRRFWFVRAVACAFALALTLTQSRTLSTMGLKSH